MPITIIGTDAQGRTVTVTIQGGKTTVQTAGYQGASCQEATRALEAALGTVTSDTPTAEFYEEGLVPETKTAR